MGIKEVFKRQSEGRTPAVILINPKHPHNVAGAMRAASCWGAHQVWFTGKRLLDQLETLRRIPREERMKGYASVEIVHNDAPFDFFPRGVTPVAIEVRQNAECLTHFDHPENAVYVFGPRTARFRVRSSRCATGSSSSRRTIA